MNKLTVTEIPEEFNSLVHRIPEIGFQRHAASLLSHATANLADIKDSIKQIPPLAGAKAKSAIVISAGPSLHKRNVIKRILNSGYAGTVISVDGAFIACLKEGLVPDFVVTLDPHPTRIVRWFGDPEFERHAEQDDYFARQDLDVNFRKNSIEHNNSNIKLVNKYAPLCKVLVASVSPPNVIKRLKAAGADLYWWNPLVDNPQDPAGLTRQLYTTNKLPCINTGGTVGTASWVFATSFFKIPAVAVTGMDFGYYGTTPIEETQTYFELIHETGNREGLERYFIDYIFPLTRERFYTDPTYFWYRKNFLELLSKTKGVTTFNCTEAGTLIDDAIRCVSLDDFFKVAKENK